MAITLTVVDLYLKSVNDSLLSGLQKNQTMLSWQKDIREGPKYKDIESKIKDLEIKYSLVRDTLQYRERIDGVLRQIIATRMTQFIEKGRPISPEESDDLKAALEPYLALLPPVNEIRQIQFALMTQARLKKMSLQYADLNTSFTEISTLVAQLPKTLLDGVSAMAETLEQLSPA